ncbi:MAG TPA: response regulator [Caulobacteraceae bacterium]|nr:response regulator [Caulobacteraceae bacterium]
MPVKVLVIDDDDLLLSLMAAAFRREGFETLSAQDGNAGLRAYNAETPALVVTDIVMPDKEGIATIIELKNRPSPPKVIAISGGGRIPGGCVLRWATHLGADDAMIKPFAMSALVAAGRHLLAQ